MGQHLQSRDGCNGVEQMQAPDTLHALLTSRLILPVNLHQCACNYADRQLTPPSPPLLPSCSCSPRPTCSAAQTAASRAPSAAACARRTAAGRVEGRGGSVRSMPGRRYAGGIAAGRQRYRSRPAEHCGAFPVSTPYSAHNTAHSLTWSTNAAVRSRSNVEGSRPL